MNPLVPFCVHIHPAKLQVCGAGLFLLIHEPPAVACGMLQPLLQYAGMTGQGNGCGRRYT